MRRLLIILSAAACYLSLSGFECASTEMTTAKLALKNKDNAKAEEALSKEVAVRPTNAEAWMLLGDLYSDEQRYTDMNNAYAKALRDGNQPPLTTEQRYNIGVRLYNGWLTKYNAALDDLNKGADTKNTTLLRQGLALLDTADILRPNYPENTFLRSTIYRELSDESHENTELRRYVEMMAPTVDIGLRAGLALNMTESAVEAKLGTPSKKKVSDSTGGYLYFDNQKLWVYLSPVKGSKPRVDGWKVAPSSEPEFVSQLPYQIRSYPEYALGVAAYQAGEKDKSRYDEALKALDRVSKYDPDRTGVSDVVSRIYINTGRTAEAKSALEAQIRANPKDPSAYITYGNLLFTMSDYNGASKAFKDVLGLGLPDTDDKVQVALFNLGAVYKNWGRTLQDSVETANKGRASTAAQQTLYQAPLKEAMGYFERLKNVKAKDGDFTVMAELANIYEVLGDKAKVKATIKEIEGVQNMADNNTNANYWRALSRLYAIVNDVDKANAADAKAGQYEGK